MILRVGTVQYRTYGPDEGRRVAEAFIRGGVVPSKDEGSIQAGTIRYGRTVYHMRSHVPYSTGRASPAAPGDEGGLKAAGTVLYRTRTVTEIGQCVLKLA